MEEDTLERYCFILEVNPGREDDYDRVHREMFPDMKAALQAAGYTNYTIFRLGTTVCGYAECVPDVATVLAKYAADPVRERWAAAMGGIARRRLQQAVEVWRLE